jgi:hypothetical protein
MNLVLRKTFLSLEKLILAENNLPAQGQLGPRRSELKY